MEKGSAGPETECIQDIVCGKISRAFCMATKTFVHAFSDQYLVQWGGVDVCRAKCHVSGMPSVPVRETPRHCFESRETLQTRFHLEIGCVVEEERIASIQYH